MKVFNLALCIFIFMGIFGAASLFSYDFNDFHSKYDTMFQNMSDSRMISNYLASDDPDMVISALKRVGALKITDVKKVVEALFAASTPSANQGKAVQRTSYDNLFNLSALVLGVIGDDSDGQIISSYFNDAADPASKVYLLRSMGNLSNSSTALSALNNFALKVDMMTDSRVVNELVNSIVLHNSKSSIGPLLEMSRSAPTSTRDGIDSAISILSKRGNDDTGTGTNG